MEIKTIELTSRTWRSIRRRIRRHRQQAKRKPESEPKFFTEQFGVYQSLCDERFSLGEKK